MLDQEFYLAKSQASLAGAESEWGAGRYDNAVSRMYYAAFQAAVAALLDASVPIRHEVSGTVSHAGVQSSFVGLLINRRKLYPSDLRSALSDLLVARIVADYRPSLTSARTARRNLEIARRFTDAVAARLGKEKDNR